MTPLGAGDVDTVEVEGRGLLGLLAPDAVDHEVDVGRPRTVGSRAGRDRNGAWPSS